MRRSGRRHARLRAAAATFGLTALLTACSSASAAPQASTTAVASPTVVSSSAAVAPTSVSSAAPVAASGDLPSPELSLTPSPGVLWPADIIDATIALGVLDNHIKLAGSDLAAGVAEQDLAQVLGASDGLADLMTQVLPGRAEVDDLARHQRGRHGLRLGVDGHRNGGDGDQRGTSRRRHGDGVTGMQDLGAALQQYQSVRVAMIDLVDRATQMRHMLLQ